MEFFTTQQQQSILSDLLESRNTAQQLGLNVMVVSTQNNIDKFNAIFSIQAEISRKCDDLRPSKFLVLNDVERQYLVDEIKSLNYRLNSVITQNLAIKGDDQCQSLHYSSL